MTTKQRAILAYSHEGVLKKLEEEHGIKGVQAKCLFKDLLRFLSVGATGRCCVPSQRIDMLWHIFLLFTLDYQEFCLKHFGRFIHHRPAVWGASDNRDVLSGDRLLEEVKRIYGRVDPANWIGTAAGSGCCDTNPSCSSAPAGSKAANRVQTKQRKRRSRIRLLQENLRARSKEVTTLKREVKKLKKMVATAMIARRTLQELFQKLQDI